MMSDEEIFKVKGRKGSAKKKEDPEILVSAGEIEETVSVGKKSEDDSHPYSERHYKISPKQFKDGDYCKVRVKYGVTKNLGNYESARMDVEVEDFCRPDKVKEAWASLKEMSVSYLNHAAANIQTYVDNKKSAKDREW